MKQKKEKLMNDLFSAEIVKMDSDEMLSLRYVSEAAVQVICITRGSGWFQIVGSEGKCNVDANVKERELFVVPKFSVVAAIAGGQGLEWFSIAMSSK